MPMFPQFNRMMKDFIEPANAFDWIDWRYCYMGGKAFREEYLEPFSDRETAEEFERRKKLTPIPTYAKKEINRVRNSLASRLPDVSRLGGSKKWRDAVGGKGRGVDLRGSSMNNFTAKMIIPEMLVMQHFGVLVDAPTTEARTQAEVPAGFRPFLRPFSVENFRAEPAPADHVSDWLAVTFRMINPTYDPKSRTGKNVYSFRHYWVDDSGEVVVQDTTESGKELTGVRRLGRPDIPFVLYDGSESLMAESCSYQITALNMISADSNYAVDSNFAFMVRKQSRSMPTHLDEDKEVQVGRGKGLLYEDVAPGFISPPVDPMSVSLEMRKVMKDEVREIVTGVLMSAGDDGTLEAGLSYYGRCLQDGENRIWDHWRSYDNTPAITVAFPETWSLKTDQERLEEANAWVDLMNKLPGQKGRKAASKEAYDRAFRGKLKTEELDAIKKEVDDAAYSTADPDIILKAKEQDVVSVETAALALGFNKDEAEKAKKDADAKLERRMAANQDAKGNFNGVDMQADGQSTREALEDREPRGEGNFNKGDQE